MKKLVASAAEKGHFRLGRHIPREGVELELSEKELAILMADERIRVTDPKPTDKPPAADPKK